MKKTFRLIDVINIVNFFNTLLPEKKDALPLKTHYTLKKAVDKMKDDAIRFDEFKKEEIEKLQALWFTDDKSDECEIPHEENGQQLLDNDGNPVMDHGRRIKPEYQKEYGSAVSDLEKKLNEILLETTTYEYSGIDIGELIDNLPDDTPLKNSDIDMLDTILGDSND